MARNLPTKRGEFPSSYAATTLNLYRDSRGVVRYVYSGPGIAPIANPREWYELTPAHVTDNPSIREDASTILAFMLDRS